MTNNGELCKDFVKLSSQTRADTDDATLNMTSDNVNELRRHLHDAQVTQHESEAISYRKERNEIMDERDLLQKRLDQNNELSKLEKVIKKMKDLELLVNKQAAEIEKLNYDLMVSLLKGTELSAQVAVWKSKSKVENGKFETCKAKLMSDLQASHLDEINLKSQLEELKSEIRLQITGSHLKAVDAVAHSKVQDELKEALQENIENHRELCNLRPECHKLKVNLRTMELKYSNEIQLHSSDLQALTLCNDKLQNTTKMLEKALLENESIKKQANVLEERLVNLTDQNSALYDLLQDHNTKVTSDNIAANNYLIADTPILSHTLTNDEINKLSSPILVRIIKCLRREKDISAANIEVLKTEKIRLVSEYETQKKQLNELTQQQVTADKSSMNEGIDLSSKYDDLMRREAVINAVTDINIRLRDEKDALVINVRDLTERVKKDEDEFVLLQEKLTLLTSKTEELQSEGTKMATESKRLKNERDNLSKMLTTEKVRLNEEVNLLKSEKLRLEQDLATTNKKLNTTIDEGKKTQDKFNKLKNQQFLKERNSHCQVTSINNVPETQACGQKRSRDDEGDSLTEIKPSSVSLQKKRTRFGEHILHGRTMCGLDIKRQSTSAKRDDEEDDLMVEGQDEGIENKVIADVAFDAEIDSKDKMESFTQEQDEGRIDGYKVRNDSDDIDETASFLNPFVKLEAYEEISCDSIFPSTPRLYGKTDESVNYPRHIVAHLFQQMDGQSSSTIATANDSDHQGFAVVVKLEDERSNEIKEADKREPVAGASGQAEVQVPHIIATENENAHKTVNEISASISQLNDDKVYSVKAEAEAEADDEEDIDVGTEIQINEGRETVSSTDNTDIVLRRSRRTRNVIRLSSTDNTDIVFRRSRRTRNVIRLSSQHPASPQQGARTPIVSLYRLKDL